jgi:hypothetical protein
MRTRLQIRRQQIGPRSAAVRIAFWTKAAMRLPNRAFWALMLVLFLVSATKHFLTFTTGPTALIYDASEYWERGERVAQGDWLQLADKVDYRTPLYPIFLAVMQSLFGEYALMATVIAQHLLHMACGLMTAWACYLISRSRLVALAGYALSVSCVTRAWYANVTLTGSLFMFFLTAMVLSLVMYYRKPSAVGIATTGALLGAATLVRPIPQMLWLPLFAVVLLQQGPNFGLRRRLAHVACAIAALAVVLSPAMVRNYLSLDHGYVARVPPINKWVVTFHDGSAANLPIPDSTAGKRLLRLVPELRAGTSEARSGYAVIATLQEQGLTNAQIDALITEVCFDAIEEHPQVFLWKTFKRLGNFWRTHVADYPYYSYYDLDDPAEYDGQKTWRIEPFASWMEVVLASSLSHSLRWLEIDFIACALGTLLLILRRDTRFIGLSLAVMFMYFPFITALLEVESYRYRRVLEPCIVIAIVAGLASGQGARGARWIPGPLRRIARSWTEAPPVDRLYFATLLWLVFGVGGSFVLDQAQIAAASLEGVYSVVAAVVLIALVTLAIIFEARRQQGLPDRIRVD